MQDHIFKTYDIRGKVGSELEIEKVYDLAKAIAFYFEEQGANVKKIAIGMDGRVHSKQILERLSNGFLDYGIDVIFIGVCPTPVLYFAQYYLNVDAAIMITASHNTKEYNGLKICLNKNCVWGKDIQKIKKIFKSERFKFLNKKSAIFEQKDLNEEYIYFLIESFPKLKNKNFKVIFDCANGATGTIIPNLIKKFNWKNAETLFQDVDGNFPNHEADPVVEKNISVLKQMVKEKFDLGIGFDGDGDRMAPITKTGQLVFGDKLTAIFAKSIATKQANIKVIHDVKFSNGVLKFLQDQNITTIMSPSGHSIIKHNMKKESAQFAGELSCHFFFNDRYFGYDDGIYAALRLLEVLDESAKNLQDLVDEIPQTFSTPELRLECKESEKNIIVEDIKIFCAKLDDVEKICTLDGILVTTTYGCALIRSSNTQPAICLRFESDTQQGLEKIKSEFTKKLENYFDKSQLQNI
ncbi:phosphomannomutase/phosphoglucomutase [Candidatus Dependentiae bacterium]|nr:phosphomannomutase/phosphoglucomutase [Candidatus Dependentiae bacterium]